MTIAVTGASGKLGSEIVRAVSGRGAGPVIGLARTPAKAAQLGVEIRPGDYDDEQGLEESLRGVQTVLLVSGMAEPSKRVEQHRHVIRAAQRAGVRKLVYTSVQGAEQGTAFSPIVQSNRQSEQDVQASGLSWVVGRNGIYIEPDVESVEDYRKAGCIANCAGEGRCGYTTRVELAEAYACLLTQDTHDGQVYNLHGEALTQARLADLLGRAFGIELVYREMSVEEYRRERVAALGEFLGRVIAGIYEGIREGAADNPSHFSRAAGREHRSWPHYFESLASSRAEP